jgi:mannose-1-phosphate guanylyltransferase/phosphomannomutase
MAMKAILLAGGYGTRMFPITLRTPKVLLPIAGKPGMQHLVELLKGAGITDIVVALNTSHKMVEEAMGDGKRFGVKLTYVYEESKGDADKLGAIGAINRVIEQIGIPEECIIVGSDNFAYGLDLNEFKKFHKEKRGVASIALYQLSDRSQVEHFGVAAVDQNGKITGFQEKPRVEHAISSLASTAIYHLEQHFFKKHLPEFLELKKKKGEKADRIGDLWQHVVNETQVFGYLFQGVWGDTNTAQTYVETNKMAMNFIDGSVKSKHNGTIMREAQIGNGVQIGEGVIIKGPSIIEDGCSIGKDAVIGPYAHLQKNCKIGSKSIVSGSILLDGAQVGDNCLVEDCLLDSLSRVENGSKVEHYSIIGYKSVVGKSARVFPNSRIWPFVEIDGEGVVEGDVKIPQHLLPKEVKWAVR